MSSNRIAMTIEDVKIDAAPEVIGALFKQLIEDPRLRQQFEESPVDVLAAAGIQVPAETARRLTKANLDSILEDLTEDEREDLNQLCILPGVAVGTRPGTRPGVRVGTRVATRTRIRCG
jgi:F420-dependent methylenetetrahydromethanopterin dehydrogenase